MSRVRSSSPAPIFSLKIKCLLPYREVFGALRRLLEDGWIERFEQEDTARQKQAYRLTATGRRHLQLELDRMKHLARAGFASFAFQFSRRKNACSFEM